jgi:hypothetical protein
MVERGGPVRAWHVPQADLSRGTLSSLMREYVLPRPRSTPTNRRYTTTCATQRPATDAQADQARREGLRRRQRPHADDEGFFSLTKNGIPGVYPSVSTKWLQGYLNEYAWRYNRRNDGRSMFEQLLLRATTGA